jgi:putative transcriptional regulator
MVVKNRLKVLIAEKNLSQGEIAEAVGISKGTFSNICNGNQNSTLETALDIAEYLNEPVEKIFYKDREIELEEAYKSFDGLIQLINELYNLYQSNNITENNLCDFYKSLIDSYKSKYGYKLLDLMTENLNGKTNSIALGVLYKY